MKRMILTRINSIEKFTVYDAFIYILSFELDRGRVYTFYT